MMAHPATLTAVEPVPLPVATPATEQPTIPEPETTADARKVRPLTSSEFTAVAVVGALACALGLLGFANSFAAVMEAARPSFGWWAWSVPLGIDLGIAVFAALDIVLARLDMRVKWLRLVPWSLTGATVYLNVAHETTVFGQIAHAALPVLWVVAVEIGAHVVRVRAGIENGTRMDSIRASRWLLAPWPTWKLWRRMVLWEIRSYPAALGRERDRLLALTDLQDTYGRIAWRWKAPRRTRALYRLGELTPTDAAAAAEMADVPALPVADTDPDTRRAPKEGSADAAADTGPGAMADTSRTPARRTVAAVADDMADTVAATRTRRKTATKARRKTGTTADRQAGKARALLSAHPDMTGAELGRRLKVSERTGLRLRSRILAELATTPANTTPDTTSDSDARTDAAMAEGDDAR